MSEGNKIIVRRMTEEVWSKGNLDTVDELVASDVVIDLVPPDFPPGREGMKLSVGMYRSAFPDLQVTSDFEIAEGDRVAQHWTSRGTHRGELMGIPASGTKVTFNGVSIYRIRGGKITKVWGAADQLGVMRQIGAVP
jgi:steroid delta-isomerase-like uncharacterized protein